MQNRIRLAMLASGGGTTVEAILRECREGGLPDIDPALLITDRPGAGVVERASRMGLINHRLIERRRFGHDIEAFGEELCQALQESNIDLVGQYGWLSLTPANVIKTFDNGRRIINQHPAPVPWFGGRGMWGKRPHAAVLKFRELCWKERDRLVDNTRVVSQFGAERFDRGAVIHYKSVPILDGDTPATLQQRALLVEWQTQTDALWLFANGLVDRPNTYIYYTDLFVLPGEEDLAKEAVRYALTTEP